MLTYDIHIVNAVYDDKQHEMLTISYIIMAMFIIIDNDLVTKVCLGQI